MDADTLLVGILVSSIGMGLVIYGKKVIRLPHLAVGVVLMLLPFVVYSVLGLTLITVALLVLLWLLRER
jgi:hypothetical protein